MSANASALAVPASSPSSKKSLALLSLAALGVVFGDLGTSPLYALQEAFNGNHGVAATPANVIGIVSLFLWSLILMVSVKYVLVLMRADNKGEGGILALLSQIASPRAGRGTGWVLLALAGAAMLYGDGVITPAVSVLSAVEGLRLAAPGLSGYIVPLTVLILVLLFLVQPFGSGKVGAAFGPILATWFVAIAILGINALAANPAILQAINPWWGIDYFLRNGLAGFVSLGAVVLCLTGAEALYADMGHFGARPIRLAWYGLALPALTLCYLGQGALLLSHPEMASRPFYSMVPGWAMFPMIVLSTLATIVASQALITAVFSLTHQSVQLGFFPRVRVLHTSGTQIGQIYLPLLNWLLMLATVAVVLAFGESGKLAAAFGLAVSATMTITTVLFAALARRHWHWPWWAVALAAGGLLLIDSAFLLANAVKIADGGWLPLLFGLFVFAVMACWFRGRGLLEEERLQRALPLEALLSSVADERVPRVPGIAVFLAKEGEGAPLVLLHHLKHNRVLHETVLLLAMRTREVPRVAGGDRLHCEWLGQGFARISADYGYMEEPDVSLLMRVAAKRLGLTGASGMNTSYFLGRQTVLAAPHSGLLHRGWMGLYGWLRQNEYSASLYFNLPPNRVVELGARVEL